MSQSNKISRVGLALIYITLIAVILFVISSLIGYLNTGADRASILHLPIYQRQYSAQHTLVDDGNEGSPITNETRDQLVEDYLLAWKRRQQGISLQQPAYFTDYFTPKMQQRYQDLITDQQSSNLREEAVDLNHQIDIKFHTLDKSLVVLEDTKVIQHRRIFHNDRLIYTETDTSAYRVVCVREDGHWRIRHLTSISSPSTSDQEIGRDDPRLISRSQVAGWQGLNYYPKDYAWDTFNAAIDDQIYLDDLQLIQSLGLNTLRVFIQYEDFGGPDVSPAKIAQLKRFLDFAIQFDLRVILTLFDFYGDYTLDDWILTDAHLVSIIEAVREHPAILAYDIKNEPDLDFESRGTDLVTEWLSHQIDVIRSLDDLHPITIGWSNAERAHTLSDKVDLVSYHYYLSEDRYQSTLDRLTTQVGDLKPILISEYGRTSYRGLWNPIQYSRDDQAQYLSSITDQSQSRQVGYLAWTLYDYPAIPTRVVGRLPWRKKYQQYYGIIDVDGVPKPAYQSLNIQDSSQD